MQLDSYLELFTTFYGWAFANIIGEVITGTGLIIVPFIVVILMAWKDAKERGMQDVGVLGVIESIQTKLIVMLFVMTVCFFTSPITSLHNTHLAYTPPPTLVEPSPHDAILPGTTDSTYDTALRDAVDGTMSASGSLAHVPLWWYSIMSISSGVNYAVRNGLNNATSDMRTLEDMARHATIEDPALLANVQRFYSECFVPARSAFVKSDPTKISAGGAGIIAESNADYGPSDVDWMGSQFFRTEHGYYDTIRSAAPVNGFVIDFDRDTDYYNPASDVDPTLTGAVNPEFGRPTCKQWWEDDGIGVRKQLISHSSAWQKFVDAASSAMSWGSDDKRLDAFARLAQAKANPTFVDTEKIMGDHYDTATTLGRFATGSIANFGVAKEGFMASLSMQPLMTALPMIQALVLMGIYTFLPLVTFLSGFNLKVLFLGAMAIFTVKFWASMWFIAAWIDGHLINAMYPGVSGWSFVQGVLSTEGQGDKRILLNTILVLLFIGLPMVWSTMIAWAGARLGGAIDDIMRGHGSAAAQSGKTGMSVVGQVVGVGRKIK